MNRILKIGIASLALGCIASVANAGTFTFTSTSHTANSLTVSEGMTTPVSANFITGEGVTTYAGGQKVDSTSSCAGWTVAPGTTPFNSNGICTFTEKNGDKATIVFGCIDNMKTQQSDCWGGLRGTAGSRKDKTGTISWHGHPSADGKAGMAAGTGQWND
jgi:hypothetical protein